MKDIKKVRIFWNSHPCEADIYLQQKDKQAAFKKIARTRYQQYQILKHIDFKSFKNKKVLEIGCGIGTDGIQFAKNGAYYTGIDLSNASVNIAKKHFALLKQKGGIIQANAESLPFPQKSFDHVYSFGVIHHTPNPKKLVQEIYRVLKKQGTIAVMLYNRTSFYYLLEVKIIRRIFFIFCDKKNFCKAFFSLFGKKIARRFEAFRQKLAKMKALNQRPTNEEWISMNTDDVFCPLARVYSKKEAEKLFTRFQDFKSSVWFIDKDNWFLWLLLGRFVPKRLEKWLDSHFGWFRLIQAKKP